MGKIRKKYFICHLLKFHYQNATNHYDPNMMKFLYSFIPFMSSGLFCNNSLDKSIFNSRVSSLFLSLLCLIDISVFNSNSVDPDHSAAFDLGWHCWHLFGGSG